MNNGYNDDEWHYDSNYGTSNSLNQMLIHVDGVQLYSGNFSVDWDDASFLL